MERGKEDLKGEGDVRNRRRGIGKVKGNVGVGRGGCYGRNRERDKRRGSWRMRERRREGGLGEKTEKGRGWNAEN